MNDTNGKKGFGTGGARPGAGRPKNSERMTIQSLNLVSKMNELDYDPIEEMVFMARDKPLDDNLRASIHKELAQYIAPKRKSVDFAVGQYTEFNLSIKAYDTSTGNGDRDSISMGPEAISAAAVELLGEEGEESSGSLASESGKGLDNDQLDSEGSS